MHSRLLSSLDGVALSEGLHAASLGAPPTQTLGGAEAASPNTTRRGTQAHQSAQFLEACDARTSLAATPQDMPTHNKTRLAQVPDEWSSRVTWLQYWRALTQYLLSPGPRLAAGLARTLQARRPQSAAASSAPPHPAVLSQHFRKGVAALHAARPPLTRPPPAPLQSASLLRSPAEDAGRAPPPPPLEALLLRRPPADHPAASPGPSSSSSSSSPADGKARPPFAASFGEGVAAWSAILTKVEAKTPANKSACERTRG